MRYAEEVFFEMCIYGVGMILGALVSFFGLWILLITNPDPEGGPMIFVFLFLSLPVGAIGGAITFWVFGTIIRIARNVRRRRSVPLPIASCCPTCGRFATMDEKAVSRLCPECHEPLPFKVFEVSAGT